MLNMIFTTGHEACTYQKLDMRSCVRTKRYTNHKPTYKVQTQRQQNNMIVADFPSRLLCLYLHEITYTYIGSILVSIDLFQGDF